MIPFNLGVCLLNTGSNIDAIEAFKLAVKIDESFLAAWVNIGSALINEGGIMKPYQQFKKLLSSTLITPLPT